MASLSVPYDDPMLPEPDRLKEPERHDVRAIELVALVEDYDVSVRLRNSITGAAAAKALPFKTIGDYADAGAVAQTIMQRDVRNFGCKTARELDALVQAVYAGQTGAVLAHARPAPSLDRAALLELFTGEMLGALVADELLSARLTNVLGQPAFAGLSFTDVLDNYQLTIATMLRQPNCGRKSSNEFRQFCQRHIRSRLVSCGYADPESLIAWLLGGPAPLEFAPLPSGPVGDSDAAGELDAEPIVFVDPHAAPEHDTLVERLEWLLGELDDRAQTILCRRNAIEQDFCETLEDIGCDMSVTRERIRQIEAKSLKRLRICIRRAPIAELLRAEGSRIWMALASGSDLLRRADLHERRKRLPGFVRLALDIEERSLEDLLGEVAQAYPFGWLAPHVDPAPIDAAAIMIEAVGGLPSPFALARLTDDVASARTAAILVRGQAIVCNYLMPPRVGARLTRLVRLHALLAGLDTVMSLEVLVRHYRAQFADDPCTERDAEIVMDAAPHLFLEIADGSWSAIGAAGTCLPAVGPEAVVEDEAFEDPGTIAHALQITLATRGPTRLVELLGDAQDILPDGRSINSIGPVLLTRRELFVRALPGVYALPRHIPACLAGVEEDWPVLFNDYQARMYALARYAGEPRDIFPLWSAEVEYLLCRWARHSGGPGILASLLAVACIEDWPVSADVADEWRLLQRQDGRFELGGSLRHAAAYELPSLDRVFAACRYAAMTGTFNWVAANRLTGRKIDSHGGAGLVALLLRLGAIQEFGAEGYRWQRSHRSTDRAAALADELDAAFGAAVEVNWESAIGDDLAMLATRNAFDDWVDDAALAGMFSWTTSPSLPDPDDDDPLAQLLAAQRRARETERRQATLAWLLED